MSDDFFNDAAKTADTQVDEPQKIKLGDEEFSQDELQKLVGLGKIGLEAEQKYKTRIDRVWPQFQSIVNEKRELEEKLKAKEAPVREEVKAPNQTFTPEQIKAEALRQAEELGIGPQAMRKTVMEVIQGQNLINDISNVIDNMTGEGLPSTTTEDILNHMQETGIRNPEKAYKDMFEKEWLESQSEKIQSIKHKGMPSVTSSSAGSKQPAPLNMRGMKEDLLAKMVGEAIAEGE
jgi:hypothetical protein